MGKLVIKGSICHFTKWQIPPCDLKLSLLTLDVLNYHYLSIFHSFEAGIADAISSFKWIKYISVYDKFAPPNSNYLINRASTKNYFIIFRGYLVWNLNKNTQGPSNTRVNFTFYASRANMTRSSNVELMLVHRQRLCTNVKPIYILLWFYFTGVLLFLPCRYNDGEWTWYSPGRGDRTGPTGDNTYHYQNKKVRLK